MTLWGVMSSQHCICFRTVETTFTFFVVLKHVCPDFMLLIIGHSSLNVIFCISPSLDFFQISSDVHGGYIHVKVGKLPVFPFTGYINTSRGDPGAHNQKPRFYISSIPNEPCVS